MYHYSAKTRTAIDLSAENSLPNRFMYEVDGVLTGHCLCEAGDLIILVTDGVHENLDAVYMGKMPQDVNEEWKGRSYVSVVSSRRVVLGNCRTQST